MYNKGEATLIRKYEIDSTFPTSRLSDETK